MSKLSQLSQVLVDKYGLDQQEANDFVSNMFTIIRERILTDHSVKIKGLGTFKLAEMSARESIDVNTGDRIMIEGRYKLSFTPENSVRDRINSPFSQFESIDLDDNVDIEKLMETPATDLDIPDLPEMPTTPESVPTPDSLIENPEPTPSTSLEAPVPDEIPTPEQQQTVEEQQQVEEELPIVEQPLVIDQPTSEEEPSIEEKPVSDEQPASDERSFTEAEPLPKTRSPFCEELIREEMKRTRTIVTMLKWLIGLVAVLLICIGLYFVYNLGKQAGRNVCEMNAEEVRRGMQTDDIPDVTFEPIVVINENPDSAIAEIVSKVKSSLENKTGKQRKDSQKEKTEPKPQNETKVENTQTPKPTVETKPAVKQEPKPADKQETKPAAQNPSKMSKAEAAKQEQYNKDPRVRTGAYVIIGVETVVTVQQGQTLQGISKAYLGEGMECYVEAVNGGITSVKPGDKLKIPKVIHKKQLKRGT